MSRATVGLIQLLRPVQWIKNVFVLAPLFFGFRLSDPRAVIDALIAAAIFCVLSSAIYVFNDLRDIGADRVHPKKRFRPLASGTVTPAAAVAAMVALLVTAVLLAYLAGFGRYFVATLVAYVAASASYSLGLKRVALLELFIVASGYVLRVITGCFAVDVAPSQWLLSATGVVALLLVTGKRRAEIADGLDPDNNRQSLRGYNLVFLDSMLSMLGSITIITYLMFTVSDYAAERYGSRYLMLSAVFVAYGVLRYLQVLKTSTGADAPTELVIRDGGLIGAVGLWVLFMAILLYL
jgi:decaprenyl-phosphate phosphoribosyltransferase